MALPASPWHVDSNRRWGGEIRGSRVVSEGELRWIVARAVQLEERSELSEGFQARERLLQVGGEGMDDGWCGGAGWVQLEDWRQEKDRERLLQVSVCSARGRGRAKGGIVGEREAADGQGRGEGLGIGARTILAKAAKWKAN